MSPPGADPGGGLDPATLGPCLLTGASGFIGGRLAARLAAHGGEVRCLARPTSDVSGLAGLGVEVVIGDLGDPGSLAGALDGCRVVVHCAALVSDWATVEEIARANVGGTRNLLAAAGATASVERFVHLSSTDVYGHRGPEAIDESYVSRGFSNWYAQTKRDAEEEVWRAHREGRLSASVLRPATVYGPGSRDVVGDIARALRAGTMLLIDGGRPVAGLLYVENLIDAVLCAAGDPAAAGRAFNVADGLEVTWREFTDDLARGLGCPGARLSLPVEVAQAIATALEQGYRLLRRSTGLSARPLLSRQAVHVLGRDQRFRTERIRAGLGWSPRVDYPEGLAATVRWLRELGI